METVACGPMDERERELWKTCDVKLRARLQTLENYSFIRTMKAGDTSTHEKYTQLLFDNYSDLVERYESIDVSRLDERFKPDVISRVYEKLLGMVYVLGDSDKLHEYNQRELSPLMTEFFSPRYQAFRECMDNAYELQRR